MARPRVSSVDDLIVNVATINIGDEAADEDLFTDEDEHEGVIVFVDQLEGVKVDQQSPKECQESTAKAPLVRKTSSQRRIQQVGTGSTETSSQKRIRRVGTGMAETSSQ